MNQGIITCFREDKDFGFIKDLTGESFYFHISDIGSAFKPERWMKVKFDVVPKTNQKMNDRAVNIIPEND